MHKGELQSWVTLIFLSVIWGTSFILIKKSLQAFDPVQVAILRMAISGIAFLPFFIFFVRKLEWHRWRFYILVGLTGSAVPALLYATAQTRISSATAGILNSMTPIFALIFGVVFFGTKTGLKQIAGIVMGFGGATALILSGKNGAGPSQDLAYGVLIILGTMFYATNVNLIKQYFQHVNSMHLSSFAFVLVSIPAVLLVPFTDIPRIVIEDPFGLTALLYLVLLSVVSTVLALILFYRLVQQTDAVFGASVAYLIPVVALLWGIFDGEYIGIHHLLSLGIIVAGVKMIRGKQGLSR